MYADRGVPSQQAPAVVLDEKEPSAVVQLGGA